MNCRLFGKLANLTNLKWLNGQEEFPESALFKEAPLTGKKSNASKSNRGKKNKYGDKLFYVNKGMWKNLFRPMKWFNEINRRSFIP